MDGLPHVPGEAGVPRADRADPVEVGRHDAGLGVASRVVDDLAVPDLVAVVRALLIFSKPPLAHPARAANEDPRVSCVCVRACARAACRGVVWYIPFNPHAESPHNVTVAHHYDLEAGARRPGQKTLGEVPCDATNTHDTPHRNMLVTLP